MASCSFRPNEHSSATVIRFFKIILRESLEDGNLKIPNKFTKMYGGGVANPVYLKPPDGTEWQVDWTKHDGGILFEKGWREFATYYSLDHGNLLLFEYKETSHFEVHIFAMSGLEIDYPFHDQINDDSVEILNELPPRRGQMKRPKSPILLSPSTSKKLKNAMKTRNVKTEGSQSEETNLEMPTIASANQDLDGKKHRRKRDSKSLISPFPATSIALKEAKKFKSENPSFIVMIRQSNLTGTVPHFPVVFFRKYFKKQQQNVKMQFGRKLWPAKLIYYPLTSNAIISAGWCTFAQASKMQAGDVCIFELINREDAVFDVHIYRGHEGKKKRRKLDSKPVVSPCAATSEALKEAKKFKSENPSFIVKIRQSNLTGSAPNFSVVFFKKFFKKKKLNVKIQFGRKLWPAKLIYYPLKSDAVISAGWSLFAQVSKLQAGDVCIFELIKREDPVLDVHIYRGQG